MDRYVLPYNACLARGRGWRATTRRRLSKTSRRWRAKRACGTCSCPRLRDDEPGTRLSNLDYAPLAEAMGRLPWAAEVFNCQAPDTGNIELLHRFATPAQRTRWLVPLLNGQMRSAFAMSEPDVASSDPTNLQTTVRREGDDLVLSGRKWFITGAAHPQCQLLIVLCRNADADQ